MGLFEVLEVWRVWCWFKASTRLEAQGLGGFYKAVQFEFTLVSLWGYFGVTLGWECFWDQFGIALGSFWDHLITFDTDLAHSMQNDLTKNPPRPCASRRVDALKQHQTLQTSKTSNKPTRGRVYPPPTPSRTVRLKWLFVRLTYSKPP